MSDTETCPSCGRENPVGATGCAHCNFPLRADAAVTTAPAATPPPAEPAAPASEPPARALQAFEPDIRRIRPLRPRPPRPPQQALVLQLWLGLGTLAILMVLWTAIQGFQKNNTPPVEGAREEQQKTVDLARAALARDSTNVQARIALADVLYDTANWADAIVQYKSAARLDSTRATTFVDMGVCYFNLGHGDVATQLFKRALTLDPHQPVAFFNLGIVAESEERFDDALKAYHEAMQSNPPEPMRQPLMDAMQRIMKRQGKSAPPLPGAGGQ